MYFFISARQFQIEIKWLFKAILQWYARNMHIITKLSIMCVLSK